MLIKRESVEDRDVSLHTYAIKRKASKIKDRNKEKTYSKVHRVPLLRSPRILICRMGFCSGSTSCCCCC